MSDVWSNKRLARRRAAKACAACLGFSVFSGAIADDQNQRCNEDAMLVFDASGSMSGNDRGGIGTTVTRIDRVREALRLVLPEVAPVRNVGLITYGPGPYNKCDNIELNLKPAPDAGEAIMAEVNKLQPAGRTPLTSAVQMAAEELKQTTDRGVIVLLTDGEDTCGGKPCSLAKSLKSSNEDIVVHVIGYRLEAAASAEGMFETRCLAEKTGGLYIAANSTEDLVEALRKTLSCQFITDLQPGTGAVHIAQRLHAQN